MVETDEKWVLEVLIKACQCLQDCCYLLIYEDRIFCVCRGYETDERLSPVHDRRIYEDRRKAINSATFTLKLAGSAQKSDHPRYSLFHLVKFASHFSFPALIALITDLEVISP